MSFLTIDENGLLLQNESPISDPDVLKNFAKTLRFDEKNTLWGDLNGESYVIEAFDAPLIAQKIIKNAEGLNFTTNFGTVLPLDLKNLFVDDFDRFYGRTEKAFYLLSNKALDELFSLLDSFDDDSLTYEGKTFYPQPFYKTQDKLSESRFWSDIYHEETKPGWDLGSAAEALKDMLPRLKLPKCRVLVLGCGFGHDAAAFAQQGHVVTAVDFSEEALQGARKQYAHLTNIDWQKCDIFELPESFHHQFDIVFEHTCFCAIDPDRRQELVEVWSRCLAPQGHLFGVFFSMFKREGPPYGVTEWEIRKRLEKKFQFLFWSRWRKSIAPRLGRELFVYAQKR